MTRFSDSSFRREREKSNGKAGFSPSSTRRRTLERRFGRLERRFPVEDQAENRTAKEAKSAKKDREI